MSKAFAVKVLISDQVTMRTTDGTSSVVVDQAVGATMTASGAGMVAKVLGDATAEALVIADEATVQSTDGTASVVVDQVAGAAMTASGAGRSATVTGAATATALVVADQATVRTTDATSSLVVDQAVGAAMTASGAGMVATVVGNTTAEVLVTSDGGEVAMSIPSIPMSVVLDPAFTILALNDVNGRVIATSGDFVALSSNEIDLIANNNVLQTQLEIRNNATLDPAAANYNELNNVDVPDLINSSRLNIVPDAAGTTVHSIFTNDGVPNIPHRTLWIMNTGTAVGQTLTLVNQSGSGTAGGLFFAPGDYVIPAGGGVLCLLDTHVTADRVWVVFGR